MAPKQAITVAYGDGIGPEIMEAVLALLEASAALLEIEKVEMGGEVFKKGHATGIPDETWASIHRTKVFLKGPMMTPQGGGHRSLNVTMRTRLGLYANVRPACSYAPFIATKHPLMDLVIIRENEEDLYAGIEYQQTPEAATATKLISRLGSERIIRFAFEYARLYGRKRVTAMAKDNILKLTDGLFHKIFDEISADYNDLEKEFYIVDIGSAKLADTPEQFDLLVLPNLYGDILSDVANQITGSVGMGGSGNYGSTYAMFEAVHGSAPKHAGQNSANPSGLLLASIQMLVHLDQREKASLIHNAWLRTLEEGIHTSDIFRPTVSHKEVGTREFTQAIIQRLGQKPQKFKPIAYEKIPPQKKAPFKSSPPPPITRELVGVDLTLYSHEPIKALIKTLQTLAPPSLTLAAVSNRANLVWSLSEPTLHHDPEATPHSAEWRCRFRGQANAISHQTVAALMHRLADARLETLRAEMLYTFNGKESFSDMS